jgi:serine protease AprX
MKMAMIVVAALSVAPLAGMAPAGAAAPPPPPKVDVLVRVQAGAVATVSAQVKLLGGDPSPPLKVLDGFTAKVPADQVDAVSVIPGVISVVQGVDVAFDPALYDPEKVSSSLYSVARNIGATDAWSHGYTGAGVDVAVIDSGVADIPQFAGHVVNGPDLSFGSGDAPDGVDLFGHGTHIAGIIAGRDPNVTLNNKLADAAKNDFVGIAPGSRIVNVKVAAPDGAVDVSQVIAAINWVVEHKNSDGLNIRVLNLSYGTDGTQDYTLDPLAFAVENAWKNGIVVVVSAGNDGTERPLLANPAVDPFVLAVGATNTNGTADAGDDTVADFSSRGNLVRRPDVLAPGQSIVSLRDPDSLIDQAFPGGRVGDEFFRGSGSSQAAAVTSGAVALLLQQFPNLTPDQVKADLIAAGTPIKTAPLNLLDAGLRSINVNRGVDRAKDVLSGKIKSTQDFAPATGLGTLEGARGTYHLVDDTGAVLSGEIDVTGAAWDGRTWRDDTWAGRTWRDSGWDGRTWRDSSWEGRTWRSDGWSGRTWRSDGWSGRTWRDNGWLAAEFVPIGPLT